MVKSSFSMKKKNLSMSLITRIVFAVLAVIIAYLIIKFFMNTYESFTTSDASDKSKSSSTKTTTLNLYTMVGCSHCDNFKPEWEKLTKTHPNGSTLKNGSVVVYNHYSTGDPDGLKQINADEITGFPTITIMKPDEQTAKQYSGARKMDDIWNVLNAPSKPE